MEQQEQSFLEEPQEEKLGLPLTIVSFCFPIVGAILFFVNKSKSPAKANTACYAALAGLGVGIVIRVLTMAARGH
ncbi:MAG: hypothetical protein ACJ751_15605 [Niastella sp.]|jgi:hypothetical protein|uniref:hypothetical protein n=1 Tax=Niastella sp. TaxID=1869183 RepID=UPI00389A9037